MTTKASPRILALFDVDGTLTAARKTILPDMREIIAALRKQITVGVVGGSDFIKQKEQLGEDALEQFDYNFAENGLVGYKNGELINATTILDKLGNENVKKVVNFALKYIADLDIPIKRGTFVEYRTGMLNISPIGRNCSREERNEFEQYCKIHDIRPKMVAAFEKEFADLDLQFSIGGQISFDVFPVGWDKTYCLKFLKPEEFDEIHFFGDKTYRGGNDFEIYEHERTIGHAVACPDDTIKLLKELFPAMSS